MPAREPKGVPFEVVVKGRDKTAATMYKHLRWLARKEREVLMDSVRRGLLDSILFGRRPGR